MLQCGADAVEVPRGAFVIDCAGKTVMPGFIDVHAHGAQGRFQDEMLVYGREGQPCPRCGAAVRRIVQAQRSTYFCPRCQRR